MARISTKVHRRPLHTLCRRPYVGLSQSRKADELPEWLNCPSATSEAEHTTALWDVEESVRGGRSRKQLHGWGSNTQSALGIQVTASWFPSAFQSLSHPRATTPALGRLPGQFCRLSSPWPSPIPPPLCAALAALMRSALLAVLWYSQRTRRWEPCWKCASSAEKGHGTLKRGKGQKDQSGFGTE